MNPSTAFHHWWEKTFPSLPPCDPNYHRTVQRLASELVRARGGHRRAYLFGISGSLGSGKSVLAKTLAFLLNQKQSPQTGQAVVVSLDDYYKKKSERSRSAFHALGYHPGEGISNRGPAGTHDLALLNRQIKQLATQSARGQTHLPIFDKARDDRSNQHRLIRGKVAFIIFEGWFVGAAAPTSAQAASIPSGLKRSVARALRAYQTVFKRFDGLLVFPSPSVVTITAQRIAQEETLMKQTGQRGMTDRQIERFVRYLHVDSWFPPVTSPLPPPERISFTAERDARGFSYRKISSQHRSARSFK